MICGKRSVSQELKERDKKDEGKNGKEVKEVQKSFFFLRLIDLGALNLELICASLEGTLLFLGLNDLIILAANLGVLRGKKKRKKEISFEKYQNKREWLTETQLLSNSVAGFLWSCLVGPQNVFEFKFPSLH